MEEARKNKNFGEVFKTLKSEFRRIIWPDQQTFVRQTVAVVAAAVSIGVLISLLDMVIKYGMNLIL